MTRPSGRKSAAALMADLADPEYRARVREEEAKREATEGR